MNNIIIENINISGKTEKNGLGAGLICFTSDSSNTKSNITIIRSVIRNITGNVNANGAIKVLGGVLICKLYFFFFCMLY
jgi:hypothetical protein